MKKVISTILLVILFVGSGYVVNAAPEMKSLLISKRMINIMIYKE